MNQEKTNKYIVETNNGYVNNVYAVLDGDYDFIGQLSNYPEITNGWYKFIDGNFIIDEEKKKEIIAQNTKTDRITELRKYLTDTDYITARTVEDIMGLNNPLTFVTDIIAILVKYATQYKDILAQRKIVRAEIEELEKE